MHLQQLPQLRLLRTAPEAEAWKRSDPAEEADITDWERHKRQRLNMDARTKYEAFESPKSTEFDDDGTSAIWASSILITINYIAIYIYI